MNVAKAANGPDQGLCQHGAEARFATATGTHEQRFEKGIRYKRGNDAGDGEADQHVLPDHLPFHDVGLADRLPTVA